MNKEEFELMLKRAQKEGYKIYNSIYEVPSDNEIASSIFDELPMCKIEKTFIAYDGICTKYFKELWFKED